MTTEPEILAGLKGFPDAQTAFAGEVFSTWPSALTLGWYDTSLREEAGSFAVVRANAGFDDLVGEVLRVTVERRSVFAYCLSAEDIPDDVGLYRRAFLALAVLSTEQLLARVDVIE